ncbi:Cytochrome P450 [Rhynchospora pubera]|uniref:Cytochrome P450 n=1 Tax=Rhynchospora pubera TaxID=906938 RepID=A0AAV8EEU0_9POAL|nr:Cytochrome P450 [Rhynchospora pubera]
MAELLQLMDNLSVNIVVSFFLLVSITALLHYLNKNNNNKKLPPSPPALPVLGHLHLLKKPLHHTLIDISSRYGPITFLRFGSRPALLISSHSLAEQCFTTHDVSFLNRVQLPSVMLPDLIAFCNYGSYWRNVRQIASVELLSNQQLQASLDIRAQEIKDMVHQLFKSYKSSEKSEESNCFRKLGFRKTIFELTMNVMMMLIARKRFYGDKIEDVKETQKFREVVTEWFELSGVANVEDFIPLLRILDFKGVMKRMKWLTKVMMEEMVPKIIKEHQQESIGKGKTMINRMLERGKKDSEKYSDLVIRNIAISMLLAGTETSANTIEWVMTLLLNNPDVLQKARAEIDAQVGNQRMIEESDLNHLPYFHCIISESLRLYPAAPLLVPHESCEEISLGGYEIPKGTMLLVNVYQIQRDPEIWEEPMKFMPERFEDGRSNGKWMAPFGMGRRKCPGEALAMREMGVVLGALIQCFDWQRIGSELIDLTEGSGITIPKATPLEVMYQPRKIMTDVLLQLSG